MTVTLSTLIKGLALAGQFQRTDRRGGNEGGGAGEPTFSAKEVQGTSTQTGQHGPNLRIRAEESLQRRRLVMHHSKLSGR